MMESFGDNLQNRIMKEIRERYSPTIIGHWQKPRNWGIMARADGYAKITGPCGDTVEISLKISDRTVRACTFDTDGCGTTVACASIITEMVTGRTVVEARRLDEAGVLEFCGGLPEEDRHCARLAAHALQKALDDYEVKRHEAWKKYYAR